ncbi:hypothetical protein SAMN05421766_10241 [Zobellia uliginosa]|uniref:Transposase DDE domain-containing protein n=1 Tax=Zobellia uliginosa TaxID=143224 RepID=A0ABY1KKX1_9FLAO|nr:hypothetical protein SAMN05421766_10241 [Zobellia uliginosa]
MHLSAIAYNLKKYLKFEQKRSKSGAGRLDLAVLVKSTLQYLFGTCIKHLNLVPRFWPDIKKAP